MAGRRWIFGGAHHVVVRASFVQGLHYRRLIIALITLLVVLAAPSHHAVTASNARLSVRSSFTHVPAIVPFYSCSTHCMDQNKWHLGLGEAGIATRINMARLTPPNNPGYWAAFITNEEWLTDQNESHFVETGTLTGNAGLTGVSGHYISCNPQCYWWGDWRPGDSSEWHHFLATVPSSDFGQKVTFQVNQNGANTYDVFVYTPSTTYSGVSTSNSMSPYYEELGAELYGTSYGSAQTATYSENMYYIPSRGTFYYFTSNGATSIQNPPWAVNGWVTPPSSSTTGGVWQSGCNNGTPGAC